MQMYFANGGGPCYIVSVGPYDNGNIVDFDTLVDGLALLEKEDEPTLLVFPDAKALSQANFYSLYDQALQQCNKLQDRFTIIDTHASDDTEDDAENLRDGISLGKDYLKYGAAYYPYLETILDYQYAEGSVNVTHTSEDSQALADEIAAAENAAAQMEQALTNAASLSSDLGTADTAIQAMNAADALANASSITNVLDSIEALLTGVVASGNDAVSAANAAATAADEDGGVATDATNAGAAVDTAVNNGASALPTMISDIQGHLSVINGAANGTTVKTESALAVATVATIITVIQAVLDLVSPTLIDAVNAAQQVDTDGLLQGLTLDAVENVDNTAYNAIKAAIGEMPLTLPPSSAMAGIYARVDSDRGVWKAPANVGVSYVFKPKLKVTHDQQRDLNVHTTGKSINAIRSFTGKGILVWGARTLAGNDNEWRYVPVRRFFNMVEESVEKATEQFVFEPNDANTWVKVRAMIENFLVLQWRAGALAGAKPEEAFYVRVGLGETMTADDILNGVMNVEIGMAAVRPAEFIILKFSHKMQES